MQQIDVPAGLCGRRRQHLDSRNLNQERPGAGRTRMKRLLALAFAGAFLLATPAPAFFAGSWLEANIGAARPAGAPHAWCGYAMRLEVMAMGRPDPGPAYNAVRSWHNYGTPAPRAAVGSLFISRGHISKVVAGECPPGSVRTISGNAAGRRVSYMCEPLSSLVVSRFP